MWLLEYKRDCRRYGEPDDIEMKLYSTKEKTIAAFPNLMDVLSPWEGDWENGLKSFSAEDEENYLGFKYFADSVRARNGGGVLLINEDDAHETVTISVERIQVDPPDCQNRRPQPTTYDTDDDVGYGVGY